MAEQDTTKLPEPLDLMSYIDAASEAAERSRWVILIMVVVGILIFASFWNTRAGSWANQTTVLFRLAAKWFDAGADVRDTLSSEDRQLFDRAAVLIKGAKASGFVSRNEFRESVQVLERVRVETLTFIKVPIVGIAVDINDLGMLGGISLVIILVMLRFSLARELDNVRQVFSAARRAHCSRVCYELLAMRQVLTVPPALSGTRAWNAVSAVLLLLPLVVQATMFSYDIKSINVGWLLAPFNAVFATIVSGISLLLTVALTVSCVRLSRMADREWGLEAARLGLDS